MGIQVRHIQLADFSEQMAALTVRNWNETGCKFDFAPDFARYQALIDAGALVAFGAFEGETMVGYCTLFLSPHMFNPAVLCAFTESLFVAPEYRNGFAAYRLIEAAEAAAKARGCRVIYWHLAAGTRMPQVMARRGYREADIVMEKELGNG